MSQLLSTCIRCGHKTLFPIKVLIVQSDSTQKEVEYCDECYRFKYGNRTTK